MNVLCKYNFESDIPRLQSLWQRNDTIDLLRRLINYIRTRSGTEALEVFRQLRACDDPLQVAKLLST
jgi:hypothetical protein